MGVRKRETATQAPPKKEEQENNEVKEEKALPGSPFRRFLCYMFEEDDASYLAVFRIMWGLIMMLEIYQHIIHDFNKTMGSFYANPSFQYKFWGLEWCVPPTDVFHMKIFMVTMLILATCVTVGFLYRVTSVGFTLGFIYMYALEAGWYLNHFYLVIVMSVMLCFLPCHVYFSVDAMLFPSVARKTVPKWCLWLIRAELWIVYTYAGVAKINEDWMRSEPLRHWLIKRMRYPLIGWLLQYEPVVYWFSWSGLIYDLIVGTLLIVPRTFHIGLFSTVFFHLSNKYIFNIGIFPWLMIASTCLYFEPYWPRRLVHMVRELPKRRPERFTKYHKATWATTKVRPLTIKEWCVLLLCLCFLSQQFLTPLRHHLYPGNVFWNEHGHRYSWRMKLRDKQCEGEFYAYLPQSKVWFEYPVNNALTHMQYQKATSHPEFAAQAIHFLRDQHALRNGEVPEFYAYLACRVNYRRVAMLSNPRVNLSAVDVWDWPFDWVEEMPALTEEEAAQLPWNFEWNFNWLRFPWKSNLEVLRQEQQNNLDQMRELASSWKDDFRNWVIEEKFGGNVAEADAHHRVLVDENKKEKQREAARRGLLLNV